jgi:hypothetical protein
VIRRSKAAYFRILAVEIFRFGKIKLPLVQEVDSVGHFCTAVLCISERLQGRVQLDEDSVHLTSTSTATICRHCRQKDGTYLESAYFLRIHPNYLVRCSRLRAARFAYLARVWVPCTYVVDARVITQVMTRIVCNA